MLEEHIGYLSDTRRTSLYRTALVKAVRAGDCVMDLGCGCGVLGLLSLEAGAGRIIGIESGPILEVARQSFGLLGAGDRFVGLNGQSHRLDIPEQVDVVVCDHVGYFGFDYGIIALLRDARQRFLKPGGTLVPSLLDLRIAPVESEAEWNKVAAWKESGIPEALHWVHELSCNTKHSASFPEEALVSRPATALQVVLGDPGPDFLKMKVAFIADRDATLHGIAGFFAARLHDDVWMTNEPGHTQAINRPQVFLPLCDPVAIRSGERIDVTLTARPSEHVIAWNIALPEQGVKYRQSTLKGETMTARTLRLVDPAYRPGLGKLAKARQIVQGYCDGTRTIVEITDAVLGEHPGLMPSEEALRHFVISVVQSDME